MSNAKDALQYQAEGSNDPQTWYCMTYTFELRNPSFQVADIYYGNAQLYLAAQFHDDLLPGLLIASVSLTFHLKPLHGTQLSALPWC